ncbi:MAG TPA: hypothetical protein ENJ43_06145 [Gammaproteobacteria bacterium]|nr:hypothetical protein [Gammaproteobacteria bacterium]
MSSIQYHGKTIPVRNLLIRPLRILITMISFLASSTVWAGPLNLADKPLFLSSSVTPNVFLQLDNSGSMRMDITTMPFWPVYCYDPTLPHRKENKTPNDDCESKKTEGGYYKWGYSGIPNLPYVFFGSIFPAEGETPTAGSNPTGREYAPCELLVGFKGEDAWKSTWYPRALPFCGDGSNPVSSDPFTSQPYQRDWRILSSKFNVNYYNPEEIYRPWRGSCSGSGTPCADANFTAVRANPHTAHRNYPDTPRDLTGFIYEVWIDDRGYTGNQPRRGTDTGSGDGAVNATSTPNGEIDLWDSHIRYTVEATRVKKETISYSPDEFGLHPTVTSPEYITDPAEVAAIKQNIANWYQYHRTRAQIVKAATGEMLYGSPDYRYGVGVISGSFNKSNPDKAKFVPVPAADDTDYASHNQMLLNKLFSWNLSSGGTPLRKGLQYVGNYFDNEPLISGVNYPDPILPEEKGGACQKNFAILFTDGYWNGSNPTGIGDEDGDGKSKTTLADVAKYYYDKDLNDALPNNVPPDSFDTATHQHMVTFGISFGVHGGLQDTDGDGWPDKDKNGNDFLLAEDSDWGNISSNTGRRDDVWHAAYNSKGAFISAQNPQQLLEGLSKALPDNIALRTSSASSVALSTGNISSESHVYQAIFNSEDWSGQLLSFPINSDATQSDFGELDTSGTGPKGSEWDASDKIPSYNSRVIVTWDGSSGVPFRWGSLTSAQQSALGSEAVLDYLRGDHSQEERNGGTFRNRSSRLGDIVNSDPVFVGSAAYRYQMDGYADFQNSKANRTEMIYVGANDGMLHGFDAKWGTELFAYVPSKVYDNLASLTDPDYAHRYFVDGSPTVSDVYFDGSWHTVLAGGLNKGGKGIYLLDITDPDAFSSESAASDLVLWEFTDDDDPDLGYTYGKPTIARMHNDRWAVIFGNGYNNSGSGRSVLYIAFIDKSSSGWVLGSDYIKLDTRDGWSANPNGLASPAPVDIDGDNRVDYIYAGDLHGSLWRFDVNSSDPGDWSVATLGEAGPTPLFTTKLEDGAGNRQPITVQPEVGRTPFGNGLMIYFGTGRFLEQADVSNASRQQSFYAILDRNVRVTSVDQLTEQEVLGEYTHSSGTVTRVTSNYVMESNKYGWYLDLPGAGERVVSSPQLRGGRIIFNTVISADNPCISGGSSWLMELDAYHGARLNSSPFDLNKDSSFDTDDMVEVNSEPTAVSGRKFDAIINSPSIASYGGGDKKYSSDSNGNVEVITSSSGLRADIRKSWRQLR